MPSTTGKIYNHKKFKGTESLILISVKVWLNLFETFSQIFAIPSDSWRQDAACCFSEGWSRPPLPPGTQNEQVSRKERGKFGRLGHNSLFRHSLFSLSKNTSETTFLPAHAQSEFHSSSLWSEELLHLLYIKAYAHINMHPKCHRRTNTCGCFNLKNSKEWKQRKKMEKSFVITQAWLFKQKKTLCTPAELFKPF